MLSSIREWTNGNHISIMFMHSYGKLYIEILLTIIKTHSKSKSSLKPSGKIHESLVVFFVISCQEFKATLQRDIGVCIQLNIFQAKVCVRKRHRHYGDENQHKTLHKLHLHDFRRLLTVSLSLVLMLFIIKDCLYA